MTKAADVSAPLVPHGESTDGKGCHLDLPTMEMCSKREWTLYSESLVVWLELQMILSFMAKVNKGINTYSTSLTLHCTIMYGSTQTSKEDQTSFWWFTWTLDGLRADDLKIKSITNMPSPQTLAELQTFMGMVNYLNRFSPIVAETSEPLRQLMKKTHSVYGNQSTSERSRMFNESSLTHLS